MVAAPDEPDVLMKTDVDGVVIRNVDANPDPPCVEILDDASRSRARRIAGSIAVDDGISFLLVVGFCRSWILNFSKMSFHLRPRGMKRDRYFM